MAGRLISGPAGAGKTALARSILAQLQGRGVAADFQSVYAALLLLERLPNGRYPERLASDSYVLPIAEYVRQAIITGAMNHDLDVVVTSSDGDPGRRGFLLDRLGAGATETIIDPGLAIVRERLAVDGVLSESCESAIERWYGRL